MRDTDTDTHADTDTDTDTDSGGDSPRAGETYERRRTFTVEDVRAFGELSGDQQPIHTEPDEHGRLITQGLLTATLPTQIGGELEVLARSVTLEFERPVYTGQEITCVWTTETVTESSAGIELTATVRCHNESGERVLSGAVDGLIRE